MGKEYVRNITVIGEVPSLGPLILFDDMEGLFKWGKTGTGADYTVEKDATVAYNGLACLHLATRASNPAEDDVVAAHRYLYPRPGKRYRIELLFQYENSTFCKLLEFDFSIQDGTYLHNIFIRYDPVNAKWQYKSAAGAWVDVVDGAQGLLQAGWHRLVFEFDQNAKEFKSLVCDAKEMDLSGIRYQVAGNGADQYAKLDFKVVAGSTTPPEVYIDDVLIMEI